VLSSTQKIITAHGSAPAENNTEIIVYPNPVKSGNPLTLENVTKGNTIQIYNQSGTLVKTALASDTTITLVLNLPTGMYLIRVDEKTIQIFVTQ
jgi:hypothetical protein